MEKSYFDLLVDWKKLPAYKLETRIDSFVGYVLPSVFESLFNTKVDLIIPELPLRVGTIYPKHEGKSFANRSYKVDFYMHNAKGENIFIEFKTDSGSRREKQDEYLDNSSKVKMAKILDGIIKIREATSPQYLVKYNHLIDKLKSIGLYKVINDKLEINVKNDNIIIFYIQPKKLKSDTNHQIIDFKTLSTEIPKCFPDSELLKQLSKTLFKWSND